MKRVYCLIVFLALIGCTNPASKLNKDGVKRNQAIIEGFHLIEISVSNFNEQGQPLNYTEKQAVFCGPINDFSNYLGESLYSDEEKEFIGFHQKRMDTIMVMNDNILGGEGHDKRIMDHIDSENKIDSLIRLRFPFSPKKEVTFFKKNDDYKWIHTIEKDGLSRYRDYSKGVFDTLPLAIRTDQWYIIDFSNSSNTIDRIFFRITENGEINQYNEYKVKWGV